MAIDVYCACGKHLTAPDTAVGKRGRCPTCGRTVVIRRPEAPAEEAAPEVPAQAAQAPKRPTCVIMEADKGYLAVVQQMFEEHGYDVLYATTDGAEGVEKARELKPDVIVLDVKLRPKSGFQLVQSLTDPTNSRNEGVWRSVFVMLAPKVTGRDKQYALSLGVEIFVPKPFTPVQVFPRLERRLHRRGA